MLDVIQKNKGGYIYFATLRTDNGEGHLIYLSGYGQLVTDLVDKYIEGQRDDHEELFTEWDRLIEEAKSSVGYSATHEIEDGYVYVTTFQSGIGISAEEESTMKRYTSRGRRRRSKISIISPDLTDGIGVDDEPEEEIDLSEEILDDSDLDDDQ